MLGENLTPLLRFDRPERFPVLDSFSTFSGTWVIREVPAEDGSAEIGLCLELQAEEESPPDEALVLSLPFTTVGGEPDQVGLECIADASGVQIFLDGRDGFGSGFVQIFPPLLETGRTQVWIPWHAGERWSKQGSSREVGLRLPIQWQRIGVRPPAKKGAVRVVLLQLVATGRLKERRAEWV